MSRFCYIPLDISKIDYGKERELSLDKFNKDLYILDDYKVPVSPTKDVRQNLNNLFVNTSDFKDIIVQARIDFERLCYRMSSINNELDDLIFYANNKVYNRIEHLEDYKNYLKNRYDDINLSYEYLKKVLDDMSNNYELSLNKILEDIIQRKNSASNEINKVINKYNESINELFDMKLNCDRYLNELTNKLNSTPSYNGKFTGSKVVGKKDKVKITLTLNTYFWWLSNSNGYYPASYIDDDGKIHDRSGGNFSDEKPKNPNSFAAGIEIKDEKSSPRDYYNRGYLVDSTGKSIPTSSYPPGWLKDFSYSVDCDDKDYNIKEDYGSFIKVAREIEKEFNRKYNNGPGSPEGKKLTITRTWGSKVQNGFNVNNSTYYWKSHTREVINHWGRKVNLQYKLVIEKTHNVEKKKNFTFTF